MRTQSKAEFRKSKKVYYQGYGWHVRTVAEAIMKGDVELLDVVEYMEMERNGYRLNGNNVNRHISRIKREMGEA